MVARLVSVQKEEMSVMQCVWSLASQNIPFTELKKFTTLRRFSSIKEAKRSL